MRQLYLGFGGAVQLSSCVEHAVKAGQDIRKAVMEALCNHSMRKEKKK